MARYSVNKFFGHFWQIWEVEADSDEEAWENAERKGEMAFQQVYSEPIDLFSKGYVKNLDDHKQKKLRMTTERYNELMRDAISKGMICRPYEYEAAIGLPFVDVW